MWRMQFKNTDFTAERASKNKRISSDSSFILQKIINIHPSWYFNRLKKEILNQEAEKSLKSYQNTEEARHKNAETMIDLPADPKKEKHNFTAKVACWRKFLPRIRRQIVQRMSHSWEIFPRMLPPPELSPHWELIQRVGQARKHSMLNKKVSPGSSEIQEGKRCRKMIEENLTNYKKWPEWVITL